MRFLLLLLWLPLLAAAQPKDGAGLTPAQANKQLFDRTIDELNFRTFETVYDKHFTRQKYPASLRTAAARKEFTNFENNAELQRLFANYNGVAERYKTRFGGNSLTLAEFEKQLSGVLRDRNFEFFIRGLPLDEKRSLIRTEQRVIKQAAAQFNASGSAAPPAGPEPEEPLAPAAPLTTHGPLPQESASASNAATSSPAAGSGSSPAPEEPLTSPAARAEAPGSGPGWVGYLTLLLSLGSFGLLLYTVGSLLPELHRLRRQVRALEATPATFYPETDASADYPAADYPAPDEPAAPRPSLLSRLRPQRTTELPADEYDEDEEPDEDEETDRHPRR
ncbi:hypothetical protein HHL22_06860 [Hymenobacter sp. RP-2-7]|uniref:Cathepsin propeptide inhibitor domain-containing protein n=1 Tax=Hymenobacter polaris TaxID=2682546 RepID=A0A7Y0ACP1_9BACT|nr:hypothetical protein [Hymenobacter polaris]NML64923.1 hypothetical protein [Hymenobacter polaris]